MTADERMIQELEALLAANATAPQPPVIIGSHRNKLSDACIDALPRLLTMARAAEGLAKAIRETIDRIPAHHEGEMIIEHFDGEGNYAGTENVDPITVIGCIAGALDTALASYIDGRAALDETVREG